MSSFLDQSNRIKHDNAHFINWYLFPGLLNILFSEWVAVNVGAI